MTPPAAKRIPYQLERHGVVRTDDYYWLRNREDPDTLAYLRAENDRLKAALRHTESLQQTLFDEIRSRIRETDMSAPEKNGPFVYYSRTEEGKQHRIFCRRSIQADSAEEVLLDANLVAEGKDYLAIVDFEPSPNHEMLAFSYDDRGAEKLSIRVKDLRTGSLLPDVIDGAASGLEWTADNRTLFYVNQDEKQRAHQLKRHDLGTSAAGDTVIYEETDEAFHVVLWKTRSRDYLILTLESSITSETRFASAATGAGEFRLVEPRRRDVRYYVSVHDDSFYILSNENGQKNFTLMKTPIAAPGRENWETVIPHSPEEGLEEVETFRDHLAITRRRAGLVRLEVWNQRTDERHEIDFPEPVYSIEAAGNPEYDTSTIRFVYESLITPHSVFDYDMNTRQLTLVKRDEVLGDYDPEHFEAKRLWARAPDGVAVPISLVHKKGLRRDGRNPALLYGYGAYGRASDVDFNSARLSLLERGFVFAIAHVRGGGDLNHFWHEAGKLLQKKNTFTDFIACAETLISEGYTAPDRLAAYGGSAGGLLVGAVINMRPELFRAAIANVPFVDVVTTMLDPSIPLTTQEYDEWGDPSNLGFHEYMKAYSPYDNVTPKKYPDLLITTGFNDPRVAYWEPAKWAAKLRAASGNDSLILLKTNFEAGHGGRSGRYERWRETALNYAFLLDRLGVES